MLQAGFKQLAVLLEHFKMLKKTLEKHWNLLTQENPRDRKGIEQFLSHKIYHIDNFRIF